MQTKDIKTFAIITIVIVVAVLGIIFAKNKIGTNDAQSTTGTDTQTNAVNSSITKRDTDIILFYGSTCPHCKKVDEYIKANNIDSYIGFQNLEVYDNKSNAELMQKKQDECKNLSQDDKGGVPFLYSSQTCLVGDQPIIDYLKQQAGI